MPEPRYTPTERGPARRTAAACAALVLALLVACAPPPPWDSADHLPADWGTGRFRPAVRSVMYNPSSPRAYGDLYLPTSGAPRGTIVFIHGGSFVGGERAELWRYNGPLARQLTRGWAIFNIDYALAPDEPFPAAVLDAAAAVTWVRTHAPRWGANASVVVLAGHSAGATIAADAALAANATSATPFGELPTVQGWVGVAGLYDLDHRAGNGPLARRLWGAEHPLAAPLANLDAADPPGLVLAGSLDTLAPSLHVDVLRERAAAVGHRGLRVDTAPAHAPLGCSGHVPSCGVSISKMDRFFDDVATAR